MRLSDIKDAKCIPLTISATQVGLVPHYKWLLLTNFGIGLPYPHGDVTTVSNCAAAFSKDIPSDFPTDRSLESLAQFTPFSLDTSGEVPTQNFFFSCTTIIFQYANRSDSTPTLAYIVPPLYHIPDFLFNGGTNLTGLFVGVGEINTAITISKPEQLRDSILALERDQVAVFYNSIEFEYSINFHPGSNNYAINGNPYLMQLDSNYFQMAAPISNAGAYPVGVWSYGGYIDISDPTPINQYISRAPIYYTRTCEMLQPTVIGKVSGSVHLNLVSLFFNAKDAPATCYDSSLNVKLNLDGVVRSGAFPLAASSKVMVNDYPFLNSVAEFTSCPYLINDYPVWPESGGMYATDGAGLVYFVPAIAPTIAIPYSDIDGFVGTGIPTPTPVFRIN